MNDERGVDGPSQPVRWWMGVRGAWMSTGLTFFMVGVVFTLTMPDNFALGIAFLSIGVVFFSLAGGKRAPGEGPEPDAQADDGAVSTDEGPESTDEGPESPDEGPESTDEGAARPDDNRGQ